MFDKQIIEKLRQDLGFKDPGIFEKSVYALNLLPSLLEAYPNLIFKGGTSILLHQYPPVRLSIDIDILLPEKEKASLNEQLVSVAKRSGVFKSIEEDVRGSHIPKAHFKFFYDSHFTKIEQNVLLDVVFCENPYPKMVKKSLKGQTLILQDTDAVVTIPTAEGLFGDKLTAISPKTLGLKLTKGRDMEFLKQIIDLGFLSKLVSSIDEIKKAFGNAVEQENGFRQSRFTREDVIGDILDVAWKYSQWMVKGADNSFKEINSINRGLERISNHLVGGVTTNFVYDSNQIIAEYDAGGTLQKKYVYGIGIDEPILMTSGANKYYYNLDGLGSVSEITDSTGKVVEKYSYDPWGRTSIIDPATNNLLPTSSIGNRYGFTGRELDSETGLYYYRARVYSPDLGRFLQTDPAGYSSDINLYRYCGNNVVNCTDSSGLTRITYNAGFHVPVSPGLATGYNFGSELVNPLSPTGRLQGTGNKAELVWGEICDIGVSAGFSDFSGTGGAEAGTPIDIHSPLLGKYGGLQITPRKDAVWYNPLTWIDSIQGGLGLGVALPITVTTPLDTTNSNSDTTGLGSDTTGADSSYDNSSFSYGSGDYGSSDYGSSDYGGGDDFGGDYGGDCGGGDW